MRPYLPSTCIKRNTRTGSCEAPIARLTHRRDIIDTGNWSTPQATIEAVLYCVRERGLAALREPSNQQRLITFDDAARAEVNRRIAKLEEERFE
jgi:hypothetical protein